MAAIGAAAISSSFSPSINNTLNCTQNNRLILHNPLFPSSDSSFRVPISARLSLGSPDHFPIAASTWRPAKLYAPAVAQDQTETETVGVAETETETVGVAETETETVGVAETETETETETVEVAERETETLEVAETETETLEVAETETETETVGVAETASATTLAEGEQKVEEGSSGVSTKLYIGNLPFNVDSAELAGVIQDHGSPELIEVLYNRVTGKSRGFAFVTMSSIEDCDSVIQNLDGKEYQGRILRVNMADKPRARDRMYPDTEHKLFVGNISWSVTSESLTEAFRPYGEVAYARVLFDGETGKSRGYGFVCFNTASDMEAALQAADGLELEGRSLRVSLAEGGKKS